MKKIFLLLTLATLSSCEFENIDPLNPIMITDEPLSIGTNTATLGGRVLGEGGLPVTEFGLVYSQTNPPTLNDTKIIEGSGVGSFSDIYNSFQSNTQYFYSAYGINEMGVGFGDVYGFITDGASPCDPSQDNLIDLGTALDAINNLNINNVILETESIPFGDGNLEFRATASLSAISILLYFKETDTNLPLTGQYSTVSVLDNQSAFSDGEVIVRIEDFNNFGGGQVAPGEQIFVENNNNVLTFIFCDIPVSDDYNLNGKFIFTE